MDIRRVLLTGDKAVPVVKSNCSLVLGIGVQGQLLAPVLNKC